MKKTIVLSIAILIAIAFMSFDITSSNGKAGYAGSPGEGTCNAAGCHSGNPLNAAGGSIVITAPTLIGWQYTPGQTYTINVTISRTGVTLFGFGFEALTSTGANAGTLVITNSTQTAIKTWVIGSNTRKNVVHKTNGGLTTGNTFTFTFDWIAPSTNIGTVTFYSTGNATNKSGTSSGDFIYFTSQVVAAAPTGIYENTKAINNVSVYPNPVKGYTNVSYQLSEKSVVSAKLTSLNGQTICTFFTETQAAGEKERQISIEPSIAKGIYFLSIEINDKSVFKKIVIQ